MQKNIKSDESHKALDVQQIMSEIKKEIAQKKKNGEYRDLVTKLEELQVKDLKPAQSAENSAIDGRLLDQYYIPASHRKSIIGRVANLVISKLFFVVKLFTERIFGKQEKINNQLIGEMAKVRQDLSSLATNIRNNNAQLAAHEVAIEDVNELCKGIDSLQKDVKGVQSDVKAVQGDVKGVQGDVKGLQGDVKGVQNDSKNLLKQLIKIDRNISDLRDDDIDLDYVKFENEFRGGSDEIRKRLEKYVKFFHECTNVMDVGCGRGEFIEVLHAHGTGAFGVDIDPEMVEICKTKGLNVIQADVIEYLKGIPDDSLDGMSAFQLVEHLSVKQLTSMLKLAYRKLAKGKYLVLETIYTLTVSALARNFYIDPTHIKPIHPLTLRFICESVGFKQFEYIYSDEVPDDARLQSLPGSDRLTELLNKNIENLNLFLYGPQDYALIAKK